MKKNVNNVMAILGIGVLITIGIGLNNIIPILAIGVMILIGIGFQIDASETEASAPARRVTKPIPKARSKGTLKPLPKAIPKARLMEFCQSCNQYHDVTNGNADAFHQCPTCYTVMAHVVPCKHCNQPMIITQQYSIQYKGMEIPCSKCGNKMRL
ncbi:MAG: hypothetical protein ACFFCS_19135 [Candidatus Hodarchaeota archaeon]